jgi:DNA-binding SARP family transcriptional activator
VAIVAFRAIPRIDVRLLGRPEVTARGVPLRLAGRQAQALFALLVLDRRPRSRDGIAATLWPETAASAASLRQALWLVRSGISGTGLNPDHYLDVDGETIALNPDAPIRVDSVQFERLLQARPPDAAAAIRLYRGDLAEGLGHECFAVERERLSDLFEDALAIAAADRLAAGDLVGSRRAAERLLARDDLREEAHAILISVFAQSGTRSQVVRQYRRLRAILRRELDVEPLPETEAAFGRAMARSVDDSRRRVAVEVIAAPVFAPALVARG